MRVLLISQDENVYLPTAIAGVCRGLGDRIVCLVSAPAMSTHGGAIKGLWRHVAAFGLGGTAQMACRVIRAKLRARFCRNAPDGTFYSLAHVAGHFGLPYEHVVKVNSPRFHALVDRYRPDLLISMSCPQIVGRKVRERFSLGCINVHGAPLPKYRGLMPAFWALANGETKTASTVHDLADKLDNGAILLQREVTIAPDETWEGLVRKTKSAGTEALVEVVEQIQRGTVRRLPNRDEDATYFSFPAARDRKAFLRAGRKFF